MAIEVRFTHPDSSPQRVRRAVLFSNDEPVVVLGTLSTRTQYIGTFEIATYVVEQIVLDDVERVTEWTLIDNARETLRDVGIELLDRARAFTDAVDDARD